MSTLSDTLWSNDVVPRPFTANEWERATQIYMEDKQTPKSDPSSAVFAALALVIRPVFAKDGSLERFEGRGSKSSVEIALEYLQDLLNILAFDEVSKVLHRGLFQYVKGNITDDRSKQEMLAMLVTGASWQRRINQMGNAYNN